MLDDTSRLVGLSPEPVWWSLQSVPLLVHVCVLYHQFAQPSKEKLCDRVLQQQRQQQQLYFFHPKIYKKEKFIIIVQTMIGALAARNNLRVKNAMQPVERKDV